MCVYAPDLVKSLKFLVKHVQFSHGFEYYTLFKKINDHKNPLLLYI